MKSPSNSKHELYDKAMTTLAGEGAREFWVVDAVTASITVYSKTAGVHVYRDPELAPLPIFDGGIEVDGPFAGL